MCIYIYIYIYAIANVDETINALTQCFRFFSIIFYHRGNTQSEQTYRKPHRTTNGEFPIWKTAARKTSRAHLTPPEYFNGPSSGSLLYVIILVVFIIYIYIYIYTRIIHDIHKYIYIHIISHGYNITIT